MRETQEHSVIELNARDMLLARKNKIRQKFLEEKRAMKTEAAKKELPLILKEFSMQYFGSEEIWSKLSEDEKYELHKICVGHCQKFLTITWLPILISFLSIVGLGIVFGPVQFLWLIVWLVAGVAEIGMTLEYQGKKKHIDVDEQIDYLIAKNRILKSGIRIEAILREESEQNNENPE